MMEFDWLVLGAGALLSTLGTVVAYKDGYRRGQKKGYDLGERQGWATGYRTGIKVRKVRDLRAQGGHNHEWPEKPDSTNGKWDTYVCGCTQVRKVPAGVRP